MRRELVWALLGATAIGCAPAEVDAPSFGTENGTDSPNSNNGNSSNANGNANEAGNTNGNANGNANGNTNDAGNANGNANTNGNGNTNDNVADVPFGYDTRPTNASCVAVPRPPVAGDLALSADPFAGVEGTAAGVYTDLDLAPIDLASRRSFFAIGQFGTFITWPEDHVGAPFQVLSTDDLDGFQAGGERGLLGLAIDPEYPDAVNDDRVRVYINYTGTCSGNLCSILSRFDLTMASDGSVASLSAEEQLFRVRQPEGNHNGGALLFGNDGYLYMTLGDGGSGNDPWCSGLNLGTPLGKLLRFDVHSVATGYAVPPTNPYTGDGDGPYSSCNEHQVALTAGQPDLSRTDPCPEIYAYGLRNPFRMSVDRETGWLWIGDVGQGAQEEVSAVDPSQSAPNYNLGWPVREGDAAKPGGVPAACDVLADARGPLDTDYTEPRFVHKHNGPTGLSSRSSVVAGYVYRGIALGVGYVGRFIYGDFGSGEIWAMEDPYAPGTRDVDGLESNINLRHIGFAEDAERELIILSLSGPQRLVPADPGGLGDFPQRLSQHPCFESTDPRQVVSGVIPYEPASQLWSDGASKRRFLAVPDGETIDRAANCGTLSPSDCEAQGDWELPIGSVLIKEFAIGDVAVETRVFMRHADGGWGSYSYAWNDEQTDATLLEAAVTRTVAGVAWAYPGVASCGRCHTDAAGITLGLETRQLAGAIVYPGDRRAPQLDTLDAIGLLSPALGDTPVQGYISPGSGVDVSAEARAYLHANCSICHRPGGGTNANLVLTYDTPLAEMGICNVDPESGEWPALTDPKLLVPGDPSRSVLSVRMRSTVADERMPPLATEEVDPVGTTSVDAWIQSLSACP